MAPKVFTAVIPRLPVGPAWRDARAKYFKYLANIGTSSAWRGRRGTDSWTPSIRCSSTSSSDAIKAVRPDDKKDGRPRRQRSSRCRQGARDGGFAIDGSSSRSMPEPQRSGTCIPNRIRSDISKQRSDLRVCRSEASMAVAAPRSLAFTQPRTTRSNVCWTGRLSGYRASCSSRRPGSFLRSSRSASGASRSNQSGTGLAECLSGS
jgi:hypothetical protein